MSGNFDMEIKYSWLQSYFKDKLPEPEKLAEILTMHSLEVEAAEKKGGDYIFNMAVLPNRAFDYIDHLGAVRDISAVLRIDANAPAPSREKCRVVSMKFSDIEKILGASIPEKEVIDILTRLGMEVNKKNDQVSIKIPDSRPDIELKEDITEEIARIYGYEKIEAKAPEGILAPPERNDNFFYAGVARRILTGLGFDEVYNYSFAKRGDLELENPPSKDKGFLRSNLAQGLEENYKNNSKYFKNIKIFELGKIFPVHGECLSLGAISNKADFYEMKGVVDALLSGLGIDDFFYKDHDNRVAEVRVDGKAIGHIDTNSFELNFDELVRLADESVEYNPISKYPSIVRDVAVFVPLNEKVENVLDVIENTAGKLLVNTDLFDIYENDERKSMAFHLMFQSQEKTLTDEEVNRVMNKIFGALEANPDWEVRK